MIFRTPTQKSDLKGSFYRADRPFFASGACHILTQAFLEFVENGDWKASLIAPHPGFRGLHVFAHNHRYAFDYHGFTRVDRFHDHYAKKMKRFFPGWSGDIVEINVSTTSEEFCHAYNLRMPGNFFKDPGPRAKAFVRRFTAPDSMNTAQEHDLL